MEVRAWAGCPPWVRCRGAGIERARRPPDYPWRWSRDIPFNSALIKWLYLPDFFVPPKSTNLISK